LGLATLLFVPRPIVVDPPRPPALFCGAKHARFHDPSVGYHVLLRCFQGRFLLRPDRRGVLNDIVAGVIGRAQKVWPDVRLFAHAWLSNHAHLLVQGPPDKLPAFIGFIEREISRRWGHHIDWPDRMWRRYESTALVGAESELRAFAYVLAQGTKENLVSSPLHWPGVHCAVDLVKGRRRRGIWFDGTGYGRAVQAQRTAARPKAVKKSDFARKYEIVLARLPGLRALSEKEFRAYVTDLVGEIVETARAERKARRAKVMGRRRVLETPRETRRALPPQPWFEKRRRMIVWAKMAEATLGYLHRYWAFQRAFREASQRFCAGETGVTFPPWAFRPSVFAG
jgi:REP element-mobilizing transposase RayT